MIAANELRIGNWVTVTDGKVTFPARVEYFDFSQIAEDELSNREYRPILLTSDVLLKCGFEPTPFENTFVYKQFFFDINLYQLQFDNEDAINQSEIKHLHKLQNLIFALTGQELEARL